MTRKHGVLLINLGTPDSAKPTAVFRFLKQFLNDPRVIDLPFIFRWPLVNLCIIPLRFKKSARAYEKIWSQKGSPLLINSQQLKLSLSAALGNHFQVEIGMRYGSPSIKDALKALHGCSQLTVIPLFPQYSSAATGSAISLLMKHLVSKPNLPQLFIQRDFYNFSGFIHAYTEIIRDYIKQQPIDMIVFSYHGIPERHIKKSACNAPCDRINPCPTVTDLNRYCYRAHCYETSRLIAKELLLDASQYQVSFQSRLGRTPWIKPYTDLILPQLIHQGIKNIAIVCPSFVADCLETLEEVNIRTKEQWQSLGGNSFLFIPCLNDSPPWVSAIVDMIHCIHSGSNRNYQEKHSRI